VVHRLKKQKLAIKDRTHVRPQSPSPRPQRPNAPPGQGAWEQLAVSLVGRGAQLIERALTAVARPPKVLGEGAMGCVVLGRDMREGGQVAIKVAASAAGGGDALRREYQMLRRLRGVVGVPEAKYFGRQAIAGQESFVLVMDLFGPSLEDLWWQTTGGGAGFEAGSALRLAGEMLTLLESVHRAGVVHRDVKPDNFLVGRGGKGLRLIDFGIALPRDVASDPSGFEGTLRFAPRAAHALRRQGPADDLESLVYTLAFMLRGALPWDAGAADAVAEGKRAAVAALAEGGGAGGAGALVRGLDPACAAAVAGLLAHVASLGTDDEPDYAHCRALVAAAAEVQPLISGCVPPPPAGRGRSARGALRAPGP
jgi:casein kinase 1